MTVLPKKLPESPKPKEQNPQHTLLSLTSDGLLWNVLAEKSPIPKPNALYPSRTFSFTDTSMIPLAGTSRTVSPTPAETACLVARQCWAPASQTDLSSNLLSHKLTSLCLSFPYLKKKKQKIKYLPLIQFAARIKWDNVCKVLSTVLAPSTQ